jgi:hypothetical protein
MRYALAYARCYLAMRKLGLEMVRATKEFKQHIAHARQVFARLDVEIENLRYDSKRPYHIDGHKVKNWDDPLTVLRYIHDPSNVMLKRYGKWQSTGETYRNSGGTILRGDNHNLHTDYPDEDAYRHITKIRYGIRKYIGPSAEETTRIAPWLKRTRMIEDILTIHEMRLQKLERSKVSLV